MATTGDHWALGFYDGEGQPARTSITQQISLSGGQKTRQKQQLWL
jgi:hypothetical protein